MVTGRNSAILGIGLFVLGVGVGVQAFTRTQSFPLVEAHEIRIVDSSGRPRGRWGFNAQDQELELVLSDQKGQERIRLRIDEQGRAGMSLNAGDGDSSFNVRAYPGEYTSAFAVMPHRGTVGFSVSQDENPRLVIRDFRERERVILELGSRNLPRIRFWDYTGLPRIDIGCREGPAQEPIPCFVQVLDENQQPIATLP